MPVRSATAIQISGVKTPSMSNAMTRCTSADSVTHTAPDDMPDTVQAGWP